MGVVFGLDSALGEYHPAFMTITEKQQELISSIANGRASSSYQWSELKTIILETLSEILDPFVSDSPAITQNNSYKYILQSLDSLTLTPFTIQRICELLLQPPSPPKTSPLPSEDSMDVVSQKDPVLLGDQPQYHPRQYNTIERWLFALERNINVFVPTTDAVLLGQENLGTMDVS